jgi:hypothetical protein
MVSIQEYNQQLDLEVQIIKHLAEAHGVFGRTQSGAPLQNTNNYI